MTFRTFKFRPLAVVSAAAIVLAMCAGVMWVRSVEYFDVLNLPWRGKTIEVMSVPLQVRVIVIGFPTKYRTYSFKHQRYGLVARFLLPGYSDNPGASEIWIPYWMLMLPGCAFGTVLAIKARRKFRRRIAGLCEFCGYDLRESGERCPECGNLTWAERQSRAGKARAFVQADLPCPNCQSNLKGRHVSGACPDCGYSVHSAVLQHVVVATGQSPAKVKFVRKACLEIYNRMRSSGPVVHLDARELCLRIRTYAIVEAGGRKEALAYMQSLGFHDCEDIGRIIFAFVDNGLMKARPEDRPQDFHGLFTMEELFST